MMDKIAAELLIAELIGKPYLVGTKGPDKFDCWGLAQYVQRKLFDRNMPTIDQPPTDNSPKTMMRFIRDHEARRQWKRIDEPKHGSLVEMSRSNLPFHIGVYLDIDRGGVLHCAQGIGVGFDPLILLPNAGWRGLTYHDWIG